MENQIRLNLPVNIDLVKDRDILPPKYSYRKYNSKKYTVTYYDTFDWRIYNAGLILYSIGKILFLRLQDPEILLASCGYQKRPAFIWDFTQNDVKKRLVSILGVRVLNKLCSVSLSETDGSIINEDTKKVCKISSGKIVSTKGNILNNKIQRIHLISLRGYESDTHRIATKLKKISPEESYTDLYLYILKLYGMKPGEYSTKINIKLKRTMPAGMAMKSILEVFIKIMQQNEPGIIDDLDTEYLHDFRVAVRRTRAALSQLQILFPSAAAKKFKKDFSFIGKQSNQLRDLDVYLLNEQMYKKMLPIQFRKSISGLFGQLKDERQSTYQDFVIMLNSNRYKKIMTDWVNFIDTKMIDPKITPQKAGQPIAVVIKPIIYNQLEIVLKLGDKITEETEDKKVHDLRLECKKLRYLLEFFTSLFPKKRMDTFIGHLKNLQDNLGKFNDYSVQQNFLQGYLKQHMVSDLDGKQTITALGALIGILYNKQMQTRCEFSRRYSQFASEENITMAIKMFKS